MTTLASCSQLQPARSLSCMHTTGKLEHHIVKRCYSLCSDYRAKIVAEEARFAELASTESDCSSAKRGGDLGVFGRGMMQSE